MKLITGAVTTVLAAGASLVFWPTVYGLGLAGATLFEVVLTSDRFLWGAVWMAGTLFGGL